ncbi:MAG: BrnT family toxin [Candidatus Marinimicrobia bacterium]|nr:BrnT family toxin [Candidatus Neomarinimicrobiota bacterium]
MRFEWDPEKAKSNERKHKVSFLEAQTVFYDENARFMADPDHSETEDRFVILGLSSKLRTLVVCHCYRISDNMIRIISARKATRNERDLYEEEAR